VLRSRQSIKEEVESHIRPKRELKVNLAAVFILVIERKPFLNRAQESPFIWDNLNPPSVSPLVKTSVRSTLASPMRSGSFGSSA
jgi:hypothetical protein